MRECLLTLLVAMVVTYLLTGVVRRVAIVAGVAPPVRERDVHATPTPRWGGIAMFGGLAAALVVASRLPMLHSAYESGNTRALLAGAGLICLVGVIDDKWGMDSLVKLAGQIMAAGIMVIGGIQITWLPVPGFGTLVLDPTTGPVLSILVVVVTINAVNFIDGLDGLAAGMVCIAAIAFFAYSYRLWVGYGLDGAAAPTMISAVLAGVCLGFLPHNFHPAKIFMGDSGSMLIGLFLSATAITLTGQIDPGVLAGQATHTFITHKLVPVFIPLLLPIAVLVVPLVDLLFAVVRRTSRGRSPFSADKEHLHHRLMEIGHSHRRAVLIMYFWSAFVAFLTLAFSVANRRLPLAVGGIAVAFVGMVILLMPRLRLPGRPRMREPANVNWLDRPRVARRRRRGDIFGDLSGEPATSYAAPIGPTGAAVPEAFPQDVPGEPAPADAAPRSWFDPAVSPNGHAAAPVVEPHVELNGSGAGGSDHGTGSHANGSDAGAPPPYYGARPLSRPSSSPARGRDQR